MPNTFFNNGGSYPAKTLISLMAMLFGFTCVFDVIFIFLNYYTSQVRGFIGAGFKCPGRGHCEARSPSPPPLFLNYYNQITGLGLHRGLKCPQGRCGPSE